MAVNRKTMAKSKRKLTCLSVERGSDNVYADLGLPDSGELLAKAKLVLEISKSISERKLDQNAAAKIIGVERQELAAILKGQFRRITPGQLKQFLSCLRGDIER